MALRHVVFMLVLVLVALEHHSVDAECCGSTSGRTGSLWGSDSNALGNYCGDCTRGTPCCGYRPCNIFCCACASTDSGKVCRPGSCYRRRRSIDSMLFGDEEDKVHRIVRAADLDQDGRLSYEEAHAYLTGSNSTRSKREVYSDLEALDTNQDQYLTAAEIDPAH